MDALELHPAEKSADEVNLPALVSRRSFAGVGTFARLKFQQDYRDALTELGSSVGRSGDRPRIGQLYYNFYLRTATRDSLARRTRFTTPYARGILRRL